MSVSTAVLIFGICVLLALSICLPLIYLSRWMRGRNKKKMDAKPAKRLSALEAAPGLVVVLLMFLAFAQQYIAPESWLGARVTTNEGRFWLGIFLLISVSAIGYGLRQFLAMVTKSKSSNKSKSDHPPRNDA